MQAINQRKAEAMYQALDQFDDCYAPRAAVRDRSPMNVVFNLRRPEQLPSFLSAARTAGLHGLEGHRSIGGIRASIYNAVSEASVSALIDFLDRQRSLLA
jgi:phosphoserine aminotransferase